MLLEVTWQVGSAVAPGWLGGTYPPFPSHWADWALSLGEVGVAQRGEGFRAAAREWPLQALTVEVGSQDARHHLPALEGRSGLGCVPPTDLLPPGNLS